MLGCFMDTSLFHTRCTIPSLIGHHFARVSPLHMCPEHGASFKIQAQAAASQICMCIVHQLITCVMNDKDVMTLHRVTFELHVHVWSSGFGTLALYVMAECCNHGRPLSPVDLCPGPGTSLERQMKNLWQTRLSR